MRIIAGFAPAQHRFIGIEIRGQRLARRGFACEAYPLVARGAGHAGCCPVRTWMASSELRYWDARHRECSETRKAAFTAPDVQWLACEKRVMKEYNDSAMARTRRSRTAQLSPR